METTKNEEERKIIFSYSLSNCENLIDYKEYVDFLIDLNFDEINKKFNEKKNLIISEFQKTGYSKISFSTNIKEHNACYYLYLSGKENETNTNERTYEIYKFSYLRLYGYRSSIPDRLQTDEWTMKNQKRINEIFNKINNKKKANEKSENLEIAKKKAAKEKEINSWIEKFGSAELKLMRHRNYEHQLSYEIERGLIELPGFKCVTETDYHYRDRANPSVNALEIESEYIGKYNEVRIYWEKSLEIELIVITPFWSRYDFAKEIS